MPGPNSDPPNSPQPSLAQLLQQVSDDSPDHHALHLPDPTPPPPLRFVLSFHNLTYTVKTRRRLPSLLRPKALEQDSRTKTLLDDISGVARDGEILAVMGHSGSGKTTLIDALANRISKGSLGGSVRLNGEGLESRLLKVISAYVMQDDLLYPMLTVEETLLFSAEFRLPRALTRAQKWTRVQALVDQLGLRSAARTVIGDEVHRGVSGGERRRVSIGIDIIHDPIVLFLDEPTSGLDSTSAFMVVKALRHIACSGSIVVLTIHQPSYRIVGLLDYLLLLSRGQTLYAGPPALLPTFFSDFGHPIPEHENRTEFALDLIRELETSPGGTKGLAEFQRSWRALKAHPNHDDSSNTVPLKEAIATSISQGKLVLGTREAVEVPEFANPAWAEMATLARRSFTNSWRMPELFLVRLGAVLVTGFILSTIFWRLDSSPRGVQERVGFFAFTMATTFFTCAEALPIFMEDRYIFMRETAHNAYRRSSYVLSNAIVSLPSQIILSMAFAAETFWAVGLAGGGQGFLFYSLAMLASFWAGNSFVTFLSGVIPHVSLGYTVVVAALAYFLLFSGFFIHRDRIPVYWMWFHYISLIKYPYEGVLQNEFSDPRKCFVAGSQVFDNTPLGNIPASMKATLLKTIGGSLGLNLTSTTCVMTGGDILKYQGVTQLSKWSSLMVLVGWGFFFRALFYFCLLFGSKNKRR